MLFIIQFPLSDSRPFLELETGKLSHLYWDTDVDFIRSFGHMRSRRRGGLTGWIGEDRFCESNRAIRANNLSPFLDKVLGKSYQPKIMFKRFYSDGSALGKFEIGIRFKLANKQNISENLVKELLLYILQIPVSIPLQIRYAKCELIEAGKSLSLLYLTSTTKTSFTEHINYSWVKPGKPMIMVLYTEEEKEKIHFLGRKVVTASQETANPSYYQLGYKGKTYPVWTLVEDKFDTIVRMLRIYIARLHAEKECLKKVFGNISTELIKVHRDTVEARELQYYLNSATRRITSLESKTDSLSNGSVRDLVRDSMELITPSEKSEMIEALRKFNLRLNIFRKSESFIEQLYITKDYENIYFPQVESIKDEELRLKVSRAVGNINIENVDLGLLDLGKIFEEELSLLLEQYINKSRFEISNGDLKSLSKMIDCVVRIKIVNNEHEIDFLRMERNRYAHETFSLEDRRELMRSALFYGDLYIKYITLFSDERRRIND